MTITLKNKMTNLTLNYDLSRLDSLEGLLKVYKRDLIQKNELIYVCETSYYIQVIEDMTIEDIEIDLIHSDIPLQKYFKTRRNIDN